ncbi:DoxX family protein [Nocardia cyriacigeorgica]|jgi:DoxX-like family|uniref:DoxX family protein n=1 Tax=Nocardia cyriacigeorgica TaxID=135487 RepID=UPI0013D491B4|nr:DoxX family protein [Nocardia cyriacigeorgica]MBF6454673.1 DoxX family protein [Nocardia cyriacigeorgica]MBF6477092.1 DoxX family protein [Nocardia cyriacigeorgica]MBF6552567.1 DoxX family protein [Nocardia cyriacigeorgica]NEW27134.1 DoxX family protein [Nocardia cyriacigeorgica]
MSNAYHIVAVVAGLWIGFSGFSLFTQRQFVIEPLEQYGVPRSWWPWLALAKSAGALGLILGLFIPAIGVVAAVGLILYFLGAAATTVRAHSYKTTVFPLLYLAPAAATLALQLAE